MAHFEATSSKGARLRPANEILNQLKWDHRYDQNDYLVAYYDRVADRIMSKDVSLWLSDTTEEEFIPLHRIEYFYRKKDRQVVWHRTGRLDLLSRSSDCQSQALMLAIDGQAVTVDASFPGFQNKSPEYILNRLFFEDDDEDLWSHVRPIEDTVRK